MQKLIALPAAALLALSASLPVLAQSASEPTPAADALRVVIDAETGKLRAPTADEIKAQDARQAAARAARAAAAGTTLAKPAEPVMRTHANGAKSARLNDAFHSHSVAILRADGTLDTQCHENHGAAMGALQRAATKAPATATPTTQNETE